MVVMANIWKLLVISTLIVVSCAQDEGEGVSEEGARDSKSLNIEV